ncbi:MAG: hypothetical protein ACK58O_01180, partial [Brevundimonas sp.]
LSSARVMSGTSASAAWIFAEPSAKGPRLERLMIDATHLKAHRTAASLLNQGLFPDVSDEPGAG